MAGLILDQEILDLLGVVEAVHQALELLSLRLHPLMEAMEVLRLCITEIFMAVAVAGLQRLLVHTEVQPKVAVVPLHHRRVAATGLLVRPRHKHNLV